MPRPAVLSRHRRDNHAFGCVLVDKRKLHDQHVLSIQHPSRRNVNGWPNQQVSGKLARVLHALVEERDDEAVKHGAGLTADDRNKLSALASKARVAVPEELLSGCGVEDEVSDSDDGSDSDSEGDAKVDALRDRFTILSGEVRVGNTSASVISELRSVIRSMVEAGVVSGAVGSELVASLCGGVTK